MVQFMEVFMEFPSTDSRSVTDDASFELQLGPVPFDTVTASNDDGA